MIKDCLYKIEKETPRTREYYTVQGFNVVQVPRVSHTRLEYKGDVQRVNAVHKLRSDPYKKRI